MSIREEIEEVYPAIMYISEEYDPAIVGVAEIINGYPTLIYDRDTILNILIDGGMSYEDAYEFYTFNISCAWYGDSTPIIVDQSFGCI